MAWKIELEKAAAKELDKLDPQVTRRILKFLYERVAPLEDPRSIGEALRGSRLGEFLEVSRWGLQADRDDSRQEAHHFGAADRASKPHI